METIVEEAIAGLRADGTELTIRQMGLVMKPVTAKVAGRFDGKAVSEIVRARLAGRIAAARRGSRGYGPGSPWCLCRRVDGSPARESTGISGAGRKAPCQEAVQPHSTGTA